MLYEIDTSQEYTLDWRAKGEQRILQNIRNLLSTFRYEVAFDRTKGLDPTLLDKPAETALAMYISEVYRLVETYEPNAKVKNVSATGIDSKGNIALKVVIEI
jgi:phage baseplate assembly protein W